MLTVCVGLGTKDTPQCFTTLKRIMFPPPPQEFHSRLEGFRGGVFNGRAHKVPKLVHSNPVVSLHVCADRVRV